MFSFIFRRPPLIITKAMNERLRKSTTSRPKAAIVKITPFTLFAAASWIFFFFSLLIEDKYFNTRCACLLARMIILAVSSFFVLYRKRFTTRTRKTIALINTGLISVSLLITFTELRLNPPFRMIWGTELIFIVFFIMLTTFVMIVRKQTDENQEKKKYVHPDFGDIEYISERVNTCIKNDCTKGILLLIDVKNFRIINSLYGREYGNTLIRMFSDYLYPMMSPVLEIAYMGGIEFCLWIKGGHKASVLSGLETMKWHFKKELHKDGRNIDLFIHTAGAEYPEDGMNFNQLFSRANMAMEKTQLNERQTVVFYTPEIGKNLTYENKLFFTIQAALENQSFYICYQEKFDMDGKKVMGLEALARYRSAETGALSPDVFIPIIHKFNLSIPFTNYVIESVLSDIESIDDIYGNKIPVSINIPASYFHFSDFFRYLKRNLSAKNVDPQRIIFEITEDIFIDGYETANRIFQQLQILGIRISLDDFGTGYSSLSYIQNLLIHEIKIDKSFIDFISRDNKSFILVKSICDIAAANGYHVIAEGVENQKQVDLLKQTTCDQIQGYIYSIPKELKENKRELSLTGL